MRVGDYKQDSYFDRGVGVVDFAPLDNDAIALRRQLWAATDRAYKAASEALASKKALLSHYSAEQPFDDFAKAPALQSIEPLAKLEFSPEVWEKALVKSTDLFRSDPKIQSLWAFVRLSLGERIFRKYGRNDHSPGLCRIPGSAFRRNASRRWNATGTFSLLYDNQSFGAAGPGKIGIRHGENAGNAERPSRSAAGGRRLSRPGAFLE